MQKNQRINTIHTSGLWRSG